jgi:glycosyltransferase involved in cell wall biosynthesis
MPTYNEGTRFGEAVASVVAQSFGDWELVIVDDGSSDDIDAALGVTKGGCRTRLIRHTENKGAAAARNTGIVSATGEYVAFLDSDDIWYPEKLARQLAWMTSQEQSVSCTGYRIVTPFHPQGELRISDRVELHDLLWGCGVSPGSTMIAKRALVETVGPFDASLRRLEDWEWLLRCAQFTPIDIVPEILALVNNGPRDKHAMETVRDSAAIVDQYAIAGKYHLKKRQIRILRSTLQGEVAATAFRQRRYGSAFLSFLKSTYYRPIKRASYYRRIARAVKGDVLALLWRQRSDSAQ